MSLGGTPLFLASHYRTWEYFLEEPVADLSQGCCTDVDYKSLRAVLRPRSYRSIYFLPSIWEKEKVVCLHEFSSGSYNRCVCNSGSWSAFVCGRAQTSRSALCSGFFGFPVLSSLPWQAELLHSACVSLEVLRRCDWVRERKKPTYICWDFRSSDQSSWGLQCHAPQWLHAANRSQQKKEGDGASWILRGLESQTRGMMCSSFQMKATLADG